ncbi:TonB-dependent siderophore receptor [Rhizobium terrae]|uniref:TonB-dependent siderophore receptor n=1 Tax=Rhizobium terrae TaxID=2171756 RepID=UPI000E3CEE34|nr:TonB-dependent siderophore receptor [Rhizobium terrae]
MKIETTGRRAHRTRLRWRNAVLLGCTALGALSPAVSFAQDADSSSTTLAPIVLDANGSAGVLDTSNDSKSIVATETTGVGKMPSDVLTTPASVSVVTAKEIEERGANSIEQVVQYTAGVVTDYYGSDDRYDYFKIRGFSPFTYRDGLAIGRSWGGLLEEPYAFERIEILKGANSTGFGVSDPGGSVNYVTKLPKSERFGEVYGTGGSFAHKEAGFDFGDNITEDDTLSYRLTGKFQRSDAEYDYSQDDENFIMGGITWRPTDATSLSFVFDHLDRDGTPSGGGHPRFTNLDRDQFFGEPNYNYNTANRNTYSLIFDHDFGSGLTFNASARYSKTDTGFGYAYIWDALGASDPADSLIDRSYFGSDKTIEQFIVDAHLIYETNFNDVESRTLLGIEYNKLDSDNDTYYAAAPDIDWQSPIYSGGPGALAPYNTVESNQKTHAVYFQEDLTFFDKLTVSVGLRNDWFDLKEVGDNAFTGPFSGESDISKFSKRFGVSYKITDELAAFASYAESVAPPSAGVEPTIGTQYEVGVKYRPEAFPALFSASVYDLTMENITTYEAPTYLPATVEKVRHRGIDIEAKAEVMDNINLIAAYSYIDSNIVENGVTYDGKRFAQVPEHTASIWGTYTLAGNGSRGDMTFGLGARYIGPYYFDNANTRKSDGAVVFDAAFTYKIQEHTTLQVNATNLFDEKHIANDDGGAYYYNPGRAIMATLRQTW